MFQCVSECFNKDGQLADFWFKLFPWEDIAEQELELTRMLEKSDAAGGTRFINPAYTLLFQSKGILKILYDLFPDSPYLLQADFEPLSGMDQVEKSCSAAKVPTPGFWMPPAV